MRFAVLALRMSRSATGQSCASPPVRRIAIRRPRASASAWIFVLRPPRERPTACFCSPLFRRCRAVRFDMRRVDHLRIDRSSVASEFPEQVFPDAAPCPAHKAVINRGRWAVSFRTIAPPAATLEDVNDAANDPTIVGPLDPAHIGRQMGLNTFPLLIA
jgi:hypothetical protein